MPRPRRNDPMDLEARGKRLDRTMRSRRFTLNGLSQAVGIHQNTLRLWLNGKQDMHLEDIRALSQTLEVSGAWLAFGERV